MSEEIIAKAGGGAFHLVPSGTMQAVCWAVWDLGLQRSEFNGKSVVNHKVIVAWETIDRIESGDTWDKQRYRIYKKYTLSINEKATLCKDLISWRGKPFTDEEKKAFNVGNLVGANCFLTLVHKESNGKTFANVSAVTSLPKGIAVIKPENKPECPDWVLKLKAEAVQEKEAEHIREKAKVAEEDEVPF